MGSKAYLFVDTNLFIQCLPLVELDWSRWRQFETVELVVCRPVQSELDQQKKGQGRVAKRARTANTYLRTLLTEEFIPVRAGDPVVRLVMKLELRKARELEDELDYSERDDQLVGIALEFSKHHPEDSVALLTHDLGPMATAKRLGLAVEEIPDRWLLPPETDADERRLQRLADEVMRYKAAEPAFIVEATGSPWKFTVARHVALSEPQLTMLLDELKRAHPLATEFGPREPSERPGEGVGLGIYSTRETFLPASDEEIEGYKKAYDRWVESCADFLTTLHSKLDDRQALPEVQFSITNIGNRPAESASVCFTVQGSFAVTPSQPEPEQPAEMLHLPSPPVAPRGIWRKRISALGRASYIPELLARPALASLHTPFTAPTHDPNGFYWKPRRPAYPVRSMELTCDQWRHQSDPEIFEMALHSSKEIGEHTGGIEVEIHASNLTHPARSFAPVIVDVHEEDSLEDAWALIAMLSSPK